MDAAEALTNASIGLVVSWCITWAWLGFSPVQSAGVTGVFFLASFSRAWVLRAMFKRLEARR